MNYDGPSFYKNNESDLTKESVGYRKAPLNNSEKESQSESRYFRGKNVPKSLQSLADRKKVMRNQDLIIELEERLNKNKEDYLLFSKYLSDDQLVEKIEEGTKDNLEEEPVHNEKITKKERNAEKISTKEKLIPKKIKTDLTKPNTGLHRTLSKIIAEDEEGLKNGKNSLSSLFSDK